MPDKLPYEFPVMCVFASRTQLVDYISESESIVKFIYYIFQM